MTGWTPLLDGAAAERAVDAARDVAAALAAPDAPVDVRAIGSSLAAGTSGVALFYAALAEVTGDPAAADTASELLGLAAEGVTPSDPGLHGRTVGVGWALSRLGGRLFDPDDDDSDIDDLVERLLGFDPWPGHFDLVSGLVGLGVYGLERLPRERAAGWVDRVVDRLGTAAERGPAGAAWFTSPAVFAGRAHQFPGGHYDLGFAHGVSGVVAFLAEACLAGHASARPLLADAVAWLLSQRLDGHPETRYPGMYATAGGPMAVRTAWCYGDPGVAVALAAAGRALAADDLLAEAAATARGCAGRDPAEVKDAGLCHGSAGLAHVFNRLGQALGDEDVLDLARSWYVRTLDARRPGAAFAGFPAYSPADGSYVARAGLLDGAAGVGSALLAAVAPIAPWWDGAYLVAERALAPPT